MCTRRNLPLRMQQLSDSRRRRLTRPCPLACLPAETFSPRNSPTAASCWRTRHWSPSRPTYAPLRHQNPQGHYKSPSSAQESPSHSGDPPSLPIRQPCALLFPWPDSNKPSHSHHLCPQNACASPADAPQRQQVLWYLTLPQVRPAHDASIQHAIAHRS